MQGADLMGTPFPVYINEPRSYLEMLCDGWCTAPTFLTKAGRETDPLERFKLVITFAISGLHNTCHLGKPFNPILGETYQAAFEDGTEIYCEQTCHHPPITAWQLFGPDRLYNMYGYGEWTASFRGNSVKGAQKGPLFVEFKDGTKIRYNLPVVLLNGVLWGDRIMEYEGSVTFTDEKNGLQANIHIPIPVNGFFGGFFNSNKKPPSDHLSGTITHNSKNVSDITGSWLGAIEFDGKRYWTFTDKTYIHARITNPLPSDCSNREDIQLVKVTNFKDAAEAKVKLENIQRRDAKLRKDGKEKRKNKN